MWITSLMPDDTFPEGAQYNVSYAILHYSDAPPSPSQMPPPPAVEAPNRNPGPKMVMLGNRRRKAPKPSKPLVVVTPRS